MSLADRVTARMAAREIRRADPVSMEEFGYLLGSDRGLSVKTLAGVTVGPKAALGITAWYSGVRYITETIAGLPAFVYQDTPQGRERRADPPWKVKPDTERPWFGWVEAVVMSLLHKGNSYSFKLRSELGQVVGLRPIHPDRVKPGQASDGTKVFQLDNREDIGFTTREILHIPGLSYDGVIGLNPIQCHGESLGSIAAANRYASSFFGSGTHERSYLSVPQVLEDEEADLMKAQWERHHKGIMHAHEFGVLGGGAKIETVGLNPQETQLLETRQFGVTEVARMLRLPPHKLYDLTRATFSNIEHQSIEAVTDGIVPWCTRIEAWVNFDPDLSPAANFLEFVIDGLLRGDTAARYEAYAQATGRPWATPNEVRRLEHMPALPGLDEVAAPLNMTTDDPGGDGE
jgi:HK97 family phage portal protein